MNKEAIIRQEADRVPFTLSENVKVGDIIQYGDELIAVAATNGTVGETITVYVGDVVVEAVAATDKEIKVGDKLYWDHINRVLTTDADNGGDPLIKYNPAGHAITSKAVDVDGIVRFLLNR